MEKFDIFRDLAERTAGDVYLGVVGPVRTGKSTFIKRFMELLVLPSIADDHMRVRANDELPQSAAGKMVMTVEPKFVPEEAVELSVGEGLSVRVRLVDCVGYKVPGARGFDDEFGPRMVRTPWAEEPMPFARAAEIGTRKVITEHSTIGIVVTTDGTITEIPRGDYVEAERRVIAELKEIGKPFLVLLNSTEPYSRAARDLAHQLSEEYSVGVLPINALEMEAPELLEVLREALYEFPLREVNVRLSRWVDALDDDHPLRRRAQDGIYGVLEGIARVRDLDGALTRLRELDFVSQAALVSVGLGDGAALLEVSARPELFWQVLSELTGLPVQGEHDIVRHMSAMAKVKAKYDKVAAALEEVEAKGYGIVAPTAGEIVFEEPQLFRHGHRFGVRLRASAPSIHLIKTRIEAEVMPFVGSERQGAEFLRYLTEQFEKDPARIWNSEFLGKPVHALIEEGIGAKLHRMPPNAQAKLQEALTKITNEGSGGLICIIL
ncbi:MAG: stage IV sporulation protein A [Bacillota bacterium]|nr:stage IV sporulation protein A [Bacillota bacterium]